MTGKEKIDADPRVVVLMPDGTKCCGISATTGTPLFVAPEDEPLTKSWQRAVDDAAALRGFHGHDGSQQKTEKALLLAIKNGTHDHGWRLPTAKELNENLFENRDKIGGFKEEWYRSSTETRFLALFAWDQRFDHGYRDWFRKSLEGSQRLVRS